MFLLSGAVHADVVDENSDKGEVCEGILHEALHGGGGVAHAEGHDEELELAKVSDKCRFFWLGELDLPK